MLKCNYAVLRKCGSFADESIQTPEAITLSTLRQGQQGDRYHSQPHPTLALAGIRVDANTFTLLVTPLTASLSMA